MRKEKELLIEYRQAVRDSDYEEADKAYDILYPPLKDPLFEKFKEFLKLLGSYGELDPEYMYSKAKELGLFTRGLDEVIEITKDENKFMSGVQKNLLNKLVKSFEEIKKRLEKLSGN